MFVTATATGFQVSRLDVAVALLVSEKGAGEQFPASA